jgi:diguanylate cyclase (GGDEF)-like protein
MSANRATDEPRPVPSRRGSDSYLPGVLRGSGLHPKQVGQLLLLSVGAVVVPTALLLDHAWQARVMLLAVGAAMCLALALTRWIPPVTNGSPWLLAFPLSVMAALASLGLSGHGLGTPYGGVIVLCFGYTGLTQSPRTNLALLPVGAAAYVAAMGTWTTALAIRLFIVTMVWLLLSQLLCAFTARNQALTAALQRAASTDPLTGLANRRDLDVHLLTVPANTAIAICDLDRFKQFNDTHGHLAGDQLLVDFGRLLHAELRAQDYAARYGGEEFAIVLTGTNLADAQAVFSRLRQQWAVLRPGVTFSAGIAVHDGTRNVMDTLGAADEALFAAKRAGRNRDHVVAPDVAPRLFEVPLVTC